MTRRSWGRPVGTCGHSEVVFVGQKADILRYREQVKLWFPIYIPKRNESTWIPECNRDRTTHRRKGNIWIHFSFFFVSFTSSEWGDLQQRGRENAKHMVMIRSHFLVAHFWRVEMTAGVYSAVGMMLQGSAWHCVAVVGTYPECLRERIVPEDDTMIMMQSRGYALIALGARLHPCIAVVVVVGPWGWVEKWSINKINKIIMRENIWCFLWKRERRNVQEWVICRLGLNIKRFVSLSKRGSVMDNMKL